MVLVVLEIFIILAAFWFFVGGILSYFILPDQFRETPIQRTRAIRNLARSLKRKTKEQTLRVVYQYINSRYVGVEHLLRALILRNQFTTNVEKLLGKKKGAFASCHAQNKLIITLLLNTGQFKREDIERKNYFTLFLTIHQYLLVHISDTTYYVDPWYNEFLKEGNHIL